MVSGINWLFLHVTINICFTMHLPVISPSFSPVLPVSFPLSSSVFLLSSSFYIQNIPLFLFPWFPFLLRCRDNHSVLASGTARENNNGVRGFISDYFHGSDIYNLQFVGIVYVFHLPDEHVLHTSWLPSI